MKLAFSETNLTNHSLDRHRFDSTNTKRVNSSTLVSFTIRKIV